WGHSYDGQTGSNRAPGMWMTGGAARLLERSPSGSLHASLKAANEYRNGLELAPDVACKTLLLLGDRDMMTPAKAVKPLAEAMRNAQVVTLAGCGHMLMAEQPDAVLDALISFLE
ncbi:MAG: alpha/beta fold hydrolase, partial [Hyphomicrobiaceae bacterium]